MRDLGSELLRSGDQSRGLCIGVLRAGQEVEHKWRGILHHVMKCNASCTLSAEHQMGFKVEYRFTHNTCSNNGVR